MLEKKQIEVYQKISAPVGLRERILEKYDRQEKNIHEDVFRKRIRLISSLAACFLFAVVAFSLFRGAKNPITVYVNEEVLLSETVRLSEMPRAISFLTDPTVSVPIRIESEGDTKVSVSGGEIEQIDSQSGNVLNSGKEIFIEGTASVLWFVEGGNTKDSYTMDIENSNNGYQILLSWDSDLQCWTIGCQTAD